MPKDTIRLGIIGIGAYALMAHWHRLETDDRVKVTAICRRSVKLLSEAARITGVSGTYTDWREMLDRERLDAALICTPNNLHAEQAIAALEKNLHVLVEKPMALSIRDADAMIAAARASEGHLMVGYNRRCDPKWRHVQRIIRDGAIGRLRQVSMVSYSNLSFIYDPSKTPPGARKLIERFGEIRQFMEEGLKDNWRADPALAGGGWFVDLHTHIVDAMLWFAGSSPREVSCFLVRDGLPAERAITVQAELKNGVLFSLSYTDGVDVDPEYIWGKTEITLAGDSGVIKISGDEFELSSGGERRNITSDEATGGTTGMFIDLIAAGGENPAPPEECARAVALVEASYRSAEEKRIIELEG